jgi:hypothetical protein
MIHMSDIIGAILGKGKGKRALQEDLSDDKVGGGFEQR